MKGVQEIVVKISRNVDLYIFHNVSIFLADRLGFINLYSEIEKAYNEVAFELMKKYDFHLSPFSRKFEIINAYSQSCFMRIVELLYYLF